MINVPSVDGPEGVRCLPTLVTLELEPRARPSVMLAENLRGLVGFSDSFGGMLRGLVLVGVHVLYVYVVFGDKSVTVDDVLYFPWEGKE